ncbi:MAG: ATP-binding cassette domain-containing protein [Actinomycetota bacterium]
MVDIAVRTSGLVKRFGKLAALDGVDLEVERGTVFGLLGPNGAGKTTAVRVLSTTLAPDGGTAQVLGIDVVENPAAVRARIGLAGQYAAVDPNLTGRENLRIVGRLSQLSRFVAGERAAELLERFDLVDAADRPVRTYSGGMRRRLDIAAALVRKPPILFLDEPTTGLDLHSRNELWKMIRELVTQGSTLLLTTQYLEEADHLAQRVAVIDGGKVIANDTPTALKERLGNTVIELTWNDPAAAERSERILSVASGAPVEREGSTIRIKTPEGARILIGVLRTLDLEDLEPDKLAVREPSLDDVFLALTGKHAKPVEERVEEPVGVAT